MTNAQLLAEAGINLRSKTAGQTKTQCPQCSESRGKNKKDACLSVDIDQGLYNCHHCGFAGHVFEKTKKEYVKPPARLEKLGSKALAFFEKQRGISNNTLLRFNITEAIEWMPQHNKEVTCMCFNYYRGEQLINIKYRGPEKSFKLAKDAELIFYNLNAIKDDDTAVIVEGEIDCLSMYEAGIFNCVSVPNGASKGSQKLEYLDNCYDHFANKRKFVLAVDNDEAGRVLKDELARRLGKDRCYVVQYPEGCKDANEVLLKHSAATLKEMVVNATEWPLEGIIDTNDIADEILEWYENGYPKGAKSRISGFDDLLTFVPGELTMVTGIPGHGKDEFVNNITTNLAKYEKWKFGIAGFEENSKVTVTKLIEKYAGKAFDFRKDKNHRVSQYEFERGLLFVHEFFFFINIQQVDVTIDGILQKGEELVRRKGINGLIINPWNCLEHKVPAGSNENQYISESLTKITNFALKFGVHVFLIAHPIKMPVNRETKKFEVPTLYSISGSAHFYNKTHNGFCVYRGDTVEVFMQKVKSSWLGQKGWVSFNFDVLTRQYNYLDCSVVKIESDYQPLKPQSNIQFDD